MVRIQERERKRDFQAEREERRGGKFPFSLLDYLKVLHSSSLVMPKYTFHLVSNHKASLMDFFLRIMIP